MVIECKAHVIAVMVILRFTFNNLQSNVTLLDSVPMRLVALRTTVYVVLEVVLKLQFIVDSVTSSQSVFGALFGLMSIVALSVEGIYTVDEFPYCNKKKKKYREKYNKQQKLIRTRIKTLFFYSYVGVGR